MALEDFFTLAEMNNGLTTTSRVKELVAAMVNERDWAVKNVGDMTRQWSAVANVLAATQNKDCLDLFIQIDGPQFIYNWLKDAQKFSNDTSDSFVEESISHLLQAFVKLHVFENSFTAEIWATVDDLLFHPNSKVQDNARLLFERKKIGVASVPDVGNTGALTNDSMGKCGEKMHKCNGFTESNLRDTSLSCETTGNETVHESIRDETVQSPSSDILHHDQLECGPISEKIVDSSVMDDKTLIHSNLPSLNPVLGPSESSSIDNTPAELCSLDASKYDILDDLRKFHESDVKDTKMIENYSEKLVSPNETKMSQDRSFPSSLDSAGNMNSPRERISNSFSGDNAFCLGGSSFMDSKTIDFDGKVSMSNKGLSSIKQSSIAFNTKEEFEFSQCVLWSPSSSQKHFENLKNLRSGFSSNEDDSNISRHEVCLQDDVLANDGNIVKKDMDRERGRGGKNSSINLDYGIADPLEFARQVAIEVEREVVDYREQSCSSDKVPDRNAQQSCSSDSVGPNQTRTSGVSSKDTSLNSVGTSSMHEDSAASSENQDTEKANGAQDVEISQETETSQEEINKQKAFLNFDLNVDVCSEDTDCPLNQFSVPVSVVSASRAVAVPGLPGAPLKFEGNLGWKGSAATSAFRPASSHLMHESDKNFSGGGSNGSSKQQAGLLDFDLNVAENGDVRLGVLSSDRQVLASSSIPSGESSLEMNSRPELVEFDLNLASADGGSALTDQGSGLLFPHRNVRQSLLISSSSSKQPILKNIDLNDRPSFHNDSFDHTCLSKLSHNLNFPESAKSDGSAISIMGTRVELNRRDFTSQTLPFPHSRTSELALDGNVGRTGDLVGTGSVPYVHPSLYSYAQARAPAMPFPSPIYRSGGPIPYMVDSRGAPFIPPVMGPISSLSTTFSQQPFVINMANTGSYGIGSSRGSFDLSHGTVIEGGNMDPTSLGLSLCSGPVGLMDEQLRLNSQPNNGSVFAGKRKEPENGWEHYPFKPYTPPWI